MSYYFMCDDLERAEQNRDMVSKKLYTKAYIQVEAWLAGYNVSDLPYWMYERGLVRQNPDVRLPGRRNGGRARAEKLSPERRSEIARIASHSRKSYLARVGIIE